MEQIADPCVPFLDRVIELDPEIRLGIENIFAHCRILSSNRSGISIVAGTDRAEARLVLLHELAHYLVGPTHQHDERFWRRCWDLYRRYGVDLAHAWMTETAYRKGAARYAPDAVRRRFGASLARAS